MSLPGAPVNSETFLPPLFCKLRADDEEVVKEQAKDRERAVCAVGLDVHYELDLPTNETGAYRPRRMPFNRA